MTREGWLRHRTFSRADFDPDELSARARAGGLRVSVGLPARDVADTVGPIVDAVRREWMGPRGLVDQIVVIDSGSVDGTARAAAEAGAEVVRAHEILPGAGSVPGKGEALWKSLAVLDGDIVVWLDADVAPFDAGFVPGLVGPLLHHPEVAYVKALYRRDLHGEPDAGGRVTEICARPLINLFYPELAALAQPLAGEVAGRRSLLRSLPFFTGYAVEIGLLVEIWRRLGLGAIAQVDLGERRHRHQSTAALGPMAHEITRAVLAGLAEEGRGDRSPAAPSAYARPVRRGDGFALEETARPLLRRPPLDLARGVRGAAGKDPVAADTHVGNGTRRRATGSGHGG